MVLHYQRNKAEGYGGSLLSHGYSREVWWFFPMTRVYLIDMVVPLYHWDIVDEYGGFSISQGHSRGIWWFLTTTGV